MAGRPRVGCIGDLLVEFVGSSKDGHHLIPKRFGPRQQRSDRLDRGRSRIEGTQPEMFEQATVFLYRLLGIY